MLLTFNFYIVAFLAACLELAFQEYQNEKMIFDWYKKWLVSFSQGKTLFKKKIALVLGLCPYCNGFWVSAIAYVLFINSEYQYILLFTGLNYIFIRILLKLIS